MPARTNGSATTATVKKAAARRFELPALDFKFSPLTEGTDIPPPLPSPIAEEPSEPTEGEKKKPVAEEALGNGTKPSSKTNGAVLSTNATKTSPARYPTRAGLKRSADEMPASPTLSRPGSIRRLFSRNLLNTAYANGEAEANAANGDIHAAAAASIIRPESRSDMSIMDERRARRSSGWFRRLRGVGSGDGLASSAMSINGGSPLTKRSSLMFDDAKKPKGPPPPMIPELGELEAKIDVGDGGSLGSDLFNNIK